MFIIDQPYISNFLLETIKKNNYKIIDTKNARGLINDDSLNWFDEQSAISEILKTPNTPIYTNSENALSWIENNLNEKDLTKQILLFKNKLQFREFVKDLFPDFFFETIQIEEIQSVDIDKLPLPFVIKPKVGFFSIGVHIIRNQFDWIEAKKELQIDKLKSIYPPNVLNISSFIIEEFINGEEYAVDYYYNDKGEVVILNLLHHKFSSNTDTSDRVYTTSKFIINTFKKSIEDFLATIGGKMNLRNFPAHAEIRIDENGKIVPIEINPLRFGGWCTTGDLLGIILGFNSYEFFYKNQKPNWDEIFKGKEDKLFSLIVLDNNSGLSASEIELFDYEKLSKDFEKTVLIRKTDINNYPIFGFVFSETNPQNQMELEKILVSDLRKYITVK